MCLSLSQKIKTLEDQILVLSTAPPKLKVYNGFIPQYSMSGQSGPSSTPTKNIYEGGFPLGTIKVLLRHFQFVRPLEWAPSKAKPHYFSSK